MPGCSCAAAARPTETPWGALLGRPGLARAGGPRVRGRAGDCVRAYAQYQRSPTGVVVLVPGRRALRLTWPVCLVPGYSNEIPGAQRGSERGLESCPGEL